MLISADDLTRFATNLFVAAGVPEEDAWLVATSLVESNLRGHDSHGVMRVREYGALLKRGDLRVGVELKVLQETAALLVTDGQFGFGQIQTGRLVERLVPKAREQGVACGTVVNCGHIGRLGEWVERAANEQLAAFITVNDNGVLKCVAPPGGVEPRISTNPLAIAVPTGSEPLVLDMSTSIVANGKIQVARLDGRQCPPGWLQDADGHPTTDPNSRFTDPPGTILPLGGSDSYKGFGLGLLLDVLAGGLSGGNCPPADESAVGTNNVLMLLWDPQLFCGLEHFVAEAEKLTDFVRSSRRKPGVDEIRLPGERSADVRRERLKNGIPLDDGTWQALIRLAGRLNVDVPTSEVS